MTDTTPSASVAIIIPHHNGLDDILTCLASVYALSYPYFSVLVVNNASTDNSLEAVQRAFPSVRILTNPENLGFAAACNVGARYALAAGAEYLWLLNNDTIVDRSALTALVDAATKDRSIGMTGSRIYYFDRKNVIWSAGMRIEWARGESTSIGCGDLDVGQFGQPKEVEALTGCSLLVTRRLCETVGLMEEKFFLYAEEIDWCARATRQYWKCIYTPESIVYHKVGASSGARWPTIFSYYNTRNMLEVIRRNHSFPHRELFLVTAISRTLWRTKKEFLKALITMITGPIRYRYNLSAFFGTIHFARRRFGPTPISTIMSYQNLEELRSGPNPPSSI